MTKYIATEGLDRLRTEADDFLVTEDSGPPSPTTTTTTTTTPVPVVPPPACLTIGDYVTGINFKAYGTTTGILSGYTYATPVICELTIPVTVNPVDVLNNFILLVSFGNGVVTEITQVSNSILTTLPVIYQWPGAYEVKLSVIPKNGCPINTYVKVFSAFNYLIDNLSWNLSGWASTGLNNTALASGAMFHGFQSCPPGPLDTATPLTFNYVVSNQLSGDIIFNLYSENSLSQPWETITADNKFVQLRPRWRFTDLNYNVITSLSAETPLPVYITWNGIETLPQSGTLVGHRGLSQFYYIDDIPSLNYSTVNGYTLTTPRLWVTYNTSTIPNLQDKNDGYARSYANSNVQLSSYFYVKNLSADHFNVTLNGGYISLPKVIWADTDNNFIVTVNSAILSSADFSNKVLHNYPLLSSVNPLISASVVPAVMAAVANPAFTINRYDNVNRDTGGFYKNILGTLPASSIALSSGSVNTALIIDTSAYPTLLQPVPLDGCYTKYVSSGNIAYPALSGIAQFDVTDFNKKYFVRKVNENFNYGEQLQSYALQDFIQSNTNLFYFLSAMAGTNATPDENFGTVVYEKIANFVPNNNDVIVSNVEQLYSLTKLINTEFDNFYLTPPPVLKRELDLYSAPHERLWGNREKYNTNFDNNSYHVNLGPVLSAYNINTAIISAGQKIVLNDIYNSNFYELLEVPVITSYASVTARGLNSYFSPTDTYPLSSYPLSSFFGWGVKTPVKDYYRFYVYYPIETNTPVNNLIDWNTRVDGLSTTLSENASGVDDWYKDGGILESIYSYYITKGLNLLTSKYYKAP